jgi:hypothetical protein
MFLISENVKDNAYKKLRYSNANAEASFHIHAIAL